MKNNINPDFTPRLTYREFDLLKPKALDFIKTNLNKDNKKRTKKSVVLFVHGISYYNQQTTCKSGTLT